MTMSIRLEIQVPSLMVNKSARPKPPHAPNNRCSRTSLSTKLVLTRVDVRDLCNSLLNVRVSLGFERYNNVILYIVRPIAIYSPNMLNP